MSHYYESTEHRAKPRPARPVDKSEKRVAVVTLTLLGVIAVMLALVTVAFVVPYDDFSTTPKDQNESGEAILKGVSEYTEEGVPIINFGESISYEVETCNNGVDLYVEKWLESYGKYSPSSEAELEPDERTGAVIIALQEFFVPEPICTDGTVVVEIPGRINRDIVYSLKVDYAYQANPLRTEIVSTRTEKFYLAPKSEGK